MTDTPEMRFIRETLARIEGKIDVQAQQGARTRESVVRLQVSMDDVKSTQIAHSKRIGILEGFRFKILGAVAAAGAAGGGLGAIVFKLLGG